ncbi:hypothetical protein [Bdellovibrio bacteriovorus]|uniref:hypothetical protein n=1 Tax=Bdellovibrio bacteriovorus TaxID=959 RepID=UPI0005A0B514|nr:hypothetical protein [Bdellovibrio bacteriovorus]
MTTLEKLIHFEATNETRCLFVGLSWMVFFPLSLFVSFFSQSLFLTDNSESAGFFYLFFGLLSTYLVVLSLFWLLVNDRDVACAGYRSFILNVIGCVPVYAFLRLALPMSIDLWGNYILLLPFALSLCRVLHMFARLVSVISHKQEALQAARQA